MRNGPLSGIALALTALLATALPAQAPEARALHDRASAVLAGRETDLIELRRDLHRHPELSGAEVRTAGIVAARLQALGFEVRTGVGGHGVVGVLRGGRPGRLVAYRADMDAMPSDAPDPVEFRSLTPGVRHICGHDLHIAVGLAIAEGLAAVRRDLPGSVMLIFQPAEERASGAKAMLADGVFASLKPDAIYAVHTAPLPVGRLGTAPGGLMAGRDVARVTLTGSGDLAAAADSVGHLIERLGTLAPADQFQAPPDGFILIQGVRRGPAPGGALLVGAQLAVASEESRTRARDGVLRITATLRLPDVRVEATYEAKVVAGVTNDADLVSRASTGIRAALGDSAVIDVGTAPPAFSEDFGSYQDQVPGVMYFLGVGPAGMPHTPGYVADEAAILVGAKAMTAVILARLARG
jgi:metal-dependent amidase/aminoacylase/carboxypeptidase family protein